MRAGLRIGDDQAVDLVAGHDPRRVRERGAGSAGDHPDAHGVVDLRVRESGADIGSLGDRGGAHERILRLAPRPVIRSLLARCLGELLTPRGRRVGGRPARSDAGREDVRVGPGWAPGRNEATPIMRTPALPARATAGGQALKEQVFWIERFATFEDLRAAVRASAAATTGRPRRSRSWSHMLASSPCSTGWSRGPGGGSTA